ncbi:MAG: SDR family oxidoreductase, partial [Arachnia sp.]
MGRLEGKVTVVTGASRGLGEAMAIGFAQEGASVVLAARTVADLDRVAAQCRDAGADRVEVVPTDVTREDQLTELVRATMKQFGRLDVFVANAGIAVPGITDHRMTTLDTYELDVVQRLLAVNTVGMWLSMKAALPVMARGGSFIAIGSELGRMAGAGAGVYAITKASVDLLVRIAA